MDDLYAFSNIYVTWTTSWNLHDGIIESQQFTRLATHPGSIIA